jgi:hypothetical protein
VPDQGTNDPCSSSQASPLFCSPSCRDNASMPCSSCNPLPGQSADTTVHLRQVTKKSSKFGDCPAQSRTAAFGPVAGLLLRGSLEQRVLLVIVCGMLAGGLLHSFVYWNTHLSATLLSSLDLSRSPAGQTSSGSRHIANKGALCDFCACHHVRPTLAMVITGDCVRDLDFWSGSFVQPFPQNSYPDNRRTISMLTHVMSFSRT